MAKICYERKKFNSSSAAVIKQANKILEDYAAQGYDLTLRQLYYQFVSKGLIPNKDTEYKRLGSIVNDARMAGLIDWDHITDRTRNLRSLAHWNTPQEIVESCAQQFRFDKWKSQKNYVEVWVEKDALIGVLEVACTPLDVPYFSCRGYTSQSEMWSAAMRLLKQAQAGKKTHVIHLGDHDPSGVDMSRDIEKRISVFMNHHLTLDYVRAYSKKPGEDDDAYYARISAGYNKSQAGAYHNFTLNRVALTMAQIREYDPPPNPAKLTDSRSGSYVQEYGDKSWELDALPPNVITALIRSEVGKLRNDRQWEKDKAREKDAKVALASVAKCWDDVVARLEPVEDEDQDYGSGEEEDDA